MSPQEFIEECERIQHRCDIEIKVWSVVGALVLVLGMAVIITSLILLCYR